MVLYWVFPFNYYIHESLSLSFMYELVFTRSCVMVSLVAVIVGYIDESI